VELLVLEKLVRVPRVTETSDWSNVVVDLLEVNVIVAVAPDATVATLLVMVIVGAVVS
jgi:hypothetical protein